MPDEIRDPVGLDNVSRDGEDASHNTDSAQNGMSPKTLYDRLTKHLSETENLVSYLEDALKKGSEQLKIIKAFDEKIAQIGGGMQPIATESLEASMEDVRKHVGSLEELHEKIKGDMMKLEQISVKISEILNQY